METTQQSVTDQIGDAAAIAAAFRDDAPADLIAAAIRALEISRETSLAASADSIKVAAILW